MDMRSVRRSLPRQWVLGSEMGHETAANLHRRRRHLRQAPSRECLRHLRPVQLRGPTKQEITKLINETNKPLYETINSMAAMMNHIYVHMAQAYQIPWQQPGAG